MLQLAEVALDRYLSGSDVPQSSLLFISSDFKRANETSQITAVDRTLYADMLLSYNPLTHTHPQVSNATM